MNDPTPAIPTPSVVTVPDVATVTIPWYESAVVRRLALGIIAHLLGMSPLAKYVGGADLAPYIDQGLELLGTALDSWALHARITKPNPPVAASKAAAATANGVTS